MEYVIVSCVLVELPFRKIVSEKKLFPYLDLNSDLRA